jgi:hypothetical protein
MFYKLQEDQYNALMKMFLNQAMGIIEPIVIMMRGLEKVEEPEKKE